MSAYSSTTVPVERSQGEIRKLLIGFGVQRLAFELPAPLLALPVGADA